MLLTTFIDRLQTVTNLMIKHKFIPPYWVQITTKKPDCIYYFGPFSNHAEAQKMQHGYIEDLMTEKAMGISVNIKRSLPTNLTIMQEQELF